MSRRVLLIEPYMGVTAGHPVEVVRRVAEALVALGAEVRVLGPADAPVESWSPAYPLLPVWPTSPGARRSRWTRRPLANRVRNATLPALYALRARRTLARQYRAFAPDVAVVLTCDHPEFLALAGTPHDMRVIACTHWTLGSQRIHRLSLQGFLGAMRAGVHLELAAFTDEVRDGYVAAGAPADRVIRLPYPYQGRAREVQPPNAEEFTVAYVGDARADKGFAWFAESVAQLVSFARVRIQCELPVAGVPDPEIVRAIDRLDALGSDRVELIRHSLSTEHYQNLIRSSHLVVLPYVPTSYPPGRLSGVLADAWIEGRPVVSTDGWSAADEIRRTGAGTVCAYGQTAELLDAISRVRDDYARFASAATEAGAAIVGQDNAASAAHIILDAARP